MVEYQKVFADVLNAKGGVLDIGPTALSGAGIRLVALDIDRNNVGAIRAAHEEVVATGRVLLPLFNELACRMVPDFSAPSYEQLTDPRVTAEQSLGRGAALLLDPYSDHRGRGRLEFLPAYKYGQNAHIAFGIQVAGGRGIKQSTRRLVPLEAPVAMQGRDITYLDEGRGYRRRATEWIQRVYTKQQQMGALLGILLEHAE